jgi:type II secretory pathway pseudopilin PulG
MTRVQLLILIGLAVLIAVLALPPWLQYRKVSQADGDVEEIALAIQKYHRYTGEYPKALKDLITDPGVEGWRASSIESLSETPWGGGYQLLSDSYKVCIRADHPRAPEKYRVGGITEISRVYLVNREKAERYWW